MEKANNFHSTIKSTAEMSETEITFSETKVYKGVRFNKEPVLDGQTDYKPGAYEPNRSLSHTRVNLQA